MLPNQDPSSSEWPRLDRAYTALVSLFCVILIVTNMAGLKIFKLPFTDFALSTGLLTYPITFVISDVITEIYGKKRANFMVFLGFSVTILMFMIVQMMLALPPHPYWFVEGNAFGFTSTQEYQRAFASTFNVTGTLIFASMFAYMC